MTTTTPPPGGRPDTLLSALTTQSPPTRLGSPPGGSGRAYRLADGPNPLKDINGIRSLLSTAPQEPLPKILDGENAYKIPHSLAEIENVIEKSAMKSYLPAITEILEESLDSIGKNENQDNHKAETHKIKRLLEEIHHETESPGGEETPSATAAAVTTGKHGGAERAPLNTTVPTAALDRHHLTVASQATADTSGALLTDNSSPTSNQQPLRISVSHWRATARVANGVFLLTKDAARLDAYQNNRLSWVAFSGKRLGAHPISWERRQALQKTASLPEQAILSKAMREGSAQAPKTLPTFSIEILRQGSKPTLGPPSKAVITKNQPASASEAHSEVTPKVSPETTGVQRRTSDPPLLCITLCRQSPLTPPWPIATFNHTPKRIKHHYPATVLLQWRYS